MLSPVVLVFGHDRGEEHDFSGMTGHEQIGPLLSAIFEERGIVFADPVAFSTTGFELDQHDRVWLVYWHALYWATPTFLAAIKACLEALDVPADVELLFARPDHRDERSVRATLRPHETVTFPAPDEIPLVLSYLRDELPYLPWICFVRSTIITRYVRRCVAALTPRARRPVVDLMWVLEDMWMRVTPDKDFMYVCKLIDTRPKDGHVRVLTYTRNSARHTWRNVVSVNDDENIPFNIDDGDDNDNNNNNEAMYPPGIFPSPGEMHPRAADFTAIELANGGTLLPVFRRAYFVDCPVCQQRVVVASSLCTPSHVACSRCKTLIDREEMPSPPTIGTIGEDISNSEIEDQLRAFLPSRVQWLPDVLPGEDGRFARIDVAEIDPAKITYICMTGQMGSGKSTTATNFVLDWTAAKRGGCVVWLAPRVVLAEDTAKNLASKNLKCSMYRDSMPSVCGADVIVITPHSLPQLAPLLSEDAFVRMFHFCTLLRKKQPGTYMVTRPDYEHIEEIIETGRDVKADYDLAIDLLRIIKRKYVPRDEEDDVAVAAVKWAVPPFESLKPTAVIADEFNLIVGERTAPIMHTRDVDATLKLLLARVQVLVAMDAVLVPLYVAHYGMSLLPAAVADKPCTFVIRRATYSPSKDTPAFVRSFEWPSKDVSLLPFYQAALQQRETMGVFFSDARQCEAFVTLLKSKHRPMEHGVDYVTVAADTHVDRVLTAADVPADQSIANYIDSKEGAMLLFTSRMNVGIDVTRSFARQHALVNNAAIAAQSIAQAVARVRNARDLNVYVVASGCRFIDEPLSLARALHEHYAAPRQRNILHDTRTLMRMHGFSSHDLLELELVGQTVEEREQLIQDPRNLTLAVQNQSSMGRAQRFFAIVSLLARQRFKVSWAPQIKETAQDDGSGALPENSALRAEMIRLFTSVPSAGDIARRVARLLNINVFPYDETFLLPEVLHFVRSSPDAIEIFETRMFLLAMENGMERDQCFVVATKLIGQRDDAVLGSDDLSFVTHLTQKVTQANGISTLRAFARASVLRRVEVLIGHTFLSGNDWERPREEIDDPNMEPWGWLRLMYDSTAAPLLKIRRLTNARFESARNSDMASFVAANYISVPNSGRGKTLRFSYPLRCDHWKYMCMHDGYVRGRFAVLGVEVPDAFLCRFNDVAPQHWPYLCNVCADFPPMEFAGSSPKDGLYCSRHEEHCIEDSFTTEVLSPQLIFRAAHVEAEHVRRSAADDDEWYDRLFAFVGATMDLFSLSDADRRNFDGQKRKQAIARKRQRAAEVAAAEEEEEGGPAPGLDANASQSQTL